MLCIKCLCVFLIHAKHFKVAKSEFALNFLYDFADVQIAVRFNHGICPKSRKYYLFDTDSPSKFLRVKSSAKSTILSCRP